MSCSPTRLVAAKFSEDSLQFGSSTKYRRYQLLAIKCPAPWGSGLVRGHPSSIRIPCRRLGAQHAAGFLGNLGDDLLTERVDLGVGHGLFARLHGDPDGDRLLAGVDALALVNVEHGDIDDHLFVDALRCAHDVGRLDMMIYDEGEIALDRLEC